MRRYFYKHLGTLLAIFCFLEFAPSVNAQDSVSVPIPDPGNVQVFIPAGMPDIKDPDTRSLPLPDVTSTNPTMYGGQATQESFFSWGSIWRGMKYSFPLFVAFAGMALNGAAINYIVNQFLSVSQVVSNVSDYMQHGNCTEECQKMGAEILDALSRVNNVEFAAVGADGASIFFDLMGTVFCFEVQNLFFKVTTFTTGLSAVAFVINLAPNGYLWDIDLRFAEELPPAVQAEIKNAVSLGLAALGILGSRVVLGVIRGYLIKNDSQFNEPEQNNGGSYATESTQTQSSFASRATD